MHACRSSFLILVIDILFIQEQWTVRSRGLLQDFASDYIGRQTRKQNDNNSNQNNDNAFEFLTSMFHTYTHVQCTCVYVLFTCTCAYITVIRIMIMHLSFLLV